jgi:LPS sulfotransferase NodH
MKGYLILSSPRSGTSWLGSLGNSTGVMGTSGEWIAPYILEKSIASYQPVELLATVLGKASTENGCFAVKIFPSHLKEIYSTIGADFIQDCASKHDVKIIVLNRRDRLGQAISYVRGLQTNQWAVGSVKKGDEVYDFEAIRKAYFLGAENENFWETYLELHEMDHETYVYEDLVEDSTPCLVSIAQHLEVDVPEVWESHYRIQRDAKTEEWRERFKKDVKKYGVVGPAVFRRLKTYENLLLSGLRSLRSKM